MHEKLNSLLYEAEDMADKRCDTYPNCDNCPADNQRIDCMDWLKADYLIANDVIPVVRCKDCKHFIKEEHGCEHHGYFYPVHVRDNDFCSYGERRTDG